MTTSNLRTSWNGTVLNQKLQHLQFWVVSVSSFVLFIHWQVQLGAAISSVENLGLIITNSKETKVTCRWPGEADQWRRHGRRENAWKARNQNGQPLTTGTFLWIKAWGGMPPGLKRESREWLRPEGGRQWTHWIFSVTSKVISKKRMRSCPAPCTEPRKGFPFLVIPSPPGHHRSLSKHLRLWLPSISHAAIQPTILGHSPSSSPLCLTQLKRLFHGPSLCVIRCRNSWASPTASGLSRPFPHHSASLALCFRQPQVLVAFLPRLSLSFAHGTVPLKMPFPRDFYPPSVHLNISSWDFCLL